jgi:hypothetical protein
MKNTFKAIVTGCAFFAVLAGVGAVILALGYGWAALSGGVAVNTPSQAIALNEYVRASGTTPEQAETSRTLAEADKLVNEGQAAKIEAAGKADAARMEALADLSQKTGVQPGKLVNQAAGWIVLLALAGLGIAALAILLRPKRPSPSERGES